MSSEPAAPESLSGTPAKLGSTTVTVSLSSLIVFTANLIPNKTVQEFTKIASPLIGVAVSRVLKLTFSFILYERGNWRLKKWINEDEAELRKLNLPAKRVKELNESIADYKARLRKRRLEDL